MRSSNDGGADGDWRPFETIDVGPAPVLVACDHASNRVPPDCPDLGVPAEVMAQHVAWDIGAGPVTRHLVRHLDAQAILCGTSRLVIDCNRFPGGTGSIVQVSDGIAVPGNQDLSSREVERRHDRYFEPYHQEMARRVEALTEGERVPVIVSVHTFTPSFGGVDRPWDVGVLWDPIDDRLAPTMLEQLRSRGDLVVGDNEPYTALEPLGYSLAVFGRDEGIPMAVFEIRQDLVADAAGADRWGLILAEALRPVLARPGLYRRRERAA
ncbi:MAG: N-formylglutamate amidohydrolase [Alphaproteobacteria bacterium]